MEMKEAQLFLGCMTMALMKLSHPCRQEIPCHSWKCKEANSVLMKQIFVSGGVEKRWQAGWHMIWRPCSADRTWHYMRFSQDRGERRMGLTSHAERQSESACNFSKNPEDGFHNHMDARSCQWMVVIMDYDMADHGRYNPGRRRENQKRRTDTQHLRK
jgi:hypothetical protein